MKPFPLTLAAIVAVILSGTSTASALTTGKALQIGSPSNNSTHLILSAMTSNAQTTTPEAPAEPKDDSTTPPSLNNIAFWVSDFNAMRKFYSEIIGIPEAAAGEKPRQWVFYQQGGFAFSLLKSTELIPERKGWGHCPMPGSTGDNWRPYITFSVPDLQAVIARCKAGSITVRTEKPFSLGDGFGESIEVMDPDGNAIALTQRP